MLRRVAASERARVRSLRAHAVPAGSPLRSLYQADAAQLRALLTAELARDLPALAGALLARMGEAQDLIVRAHPDDLPRLDHLDAAITRVADATLTRGGCLVQSESGTLDATVETRVARLLAAAEVTP